MNTPHKMIASAMLGMASALLPACGNMGLLTGPATPEKVWDFRQPLPVHRIRYKTAIADDTVTEDEVRKALLKALGEANSRTGYAQSWSEYYGSGSWAQQSSKALRLDYRNMINQSTTHVSTDFFTQYNVENLQTMTVSITPDNKLTKTEGFNLFGEIKPLSPYDSLENKTAEVYRAIVWPALPRTLAYNGTVTSPYSADSLMANFDRMLIVMDGSEAGLYKPEGFSHFYALNIAGQQQVIAVNFYPYRKGSRADFAYLEQYTLKPDGTNTHIKGYPDKVSALLKKVAAD